MNQEMICDFNSFIKIKDYASFIKLAYENPVIFQYLSIQRKNLQSSLPNYESFEDEQNATNEEKMRSEIIYSRISAINKELNELSKPLCDYAFEILLELFKETQDYKTNTFEIEVKENYISNGSIHIADTVYMKLDGFKEARLWFHCNSDIPQLSAVDKNGNKIHMRVTTDDEFSCEITNSDSIRDHTSGWIGSHLWNADGYKNVSKILNNLRNAINSFIVQRNLENDKI